MHKVCGRSPTVVVKERHRVWHAGGEARIRHPSLGRWTSMLLIPCSSIAARDGGWEVVQHFFVEEELVDLDTHVDGDLVLL